LARLRTIPGVSGVTVSVNGIFSGTESTSDGLTFPGYTSTRREDTTANVDSVGPGYFQILGVPILNGRDFDERDTEKAPPVAILNETMARFYFGNTDPVGKSMESGKEHLTIIGVTRDMKQQALRGSTERRFYRPYYQQTGSIPGFCFEVRTNGDAAQLVSSIRREVQGYDANLKIFRLEPVRVLIDQSITDERLIAQLSGFFGVLALVLAATGLYGIMAYAISRRVNEIGLRMALGAGQAELVIMVLRETFTLVVAGIAIGISLALAASRFVASSLEGLSATDPVTMVSAVGILLIAALAAAWLPARRAARIDPLVALRQD